MSIRLLAGIVAVAAAAAHADSWAMKLHDAANTGRAAFSIPPSRQNSGLFDAVLWQKRSPQSPGNGNFGASSMVLLTVMTTVSGLESTKPSFTISWKVSA